MTSPLPPIAFVLASLSGLILASCQTPEPAAFPDITTVRTEYVTVDSVCTAIQPIRISKDEMLSDGTLNQIINHNDIFWCKCADQRPDGFDPAICKET